MNKKKTYGNIGFIGQGYIGKNYADDFEKRGYKVVRYALEEPYNKNKDKIKKCPIVFIAVPTPTTTKGFDYSTLQKTLHLLAPKTIVVIKSTVLPGTTERLQKKFPKLTVLHSPEFLTKKTAAHDASYPERNIVGIPKNSPKYKRCAKEVLAVLPNAPFELVCSSNEAELLKYASNVFGYTKVIFMNLLYDISQTQNTRWDVLKSAMAADSKIGTWHLDPVHKGGRGAGGICLIKDFEAFRKFYMKNVSDKKGHMVFDALLEKNIQLLKKSNKDKHILKDVYGG